MSADHFSKAIMYAGAELEMLRDARGTLDKDRETRCSYANERDCWALILK